MFDKLRIFESLKLQENINFKVLREIKIKWCFGQSKRQQGKRNKNKRAQNRKGM